jgi:hypothetical protein
MHQIWKLASGVVLLFLMGRVPESTCSAGSHSAVCPPAAGQDADHLPHPHILLTNDPSSVIHQAPPTVLGLFDDSMPMRPRQQAWWSEAFRAHRLIMETAASDEFPLGLAAAPEVPPERR